MRYSRPFLIFKDLGEGTFQLSNLDGNVIEKPFNGFQLKVYREFALRSEVANDINRLHVYAIILFYASKCGFFPQIFLI